MRSVDQRLDVERRLLAALFLWPRRVDLSPSNFVTPEHGAMFDVILDAAEFYAPAELAAHTTYYDDAFLEVVISFARSYAAANYKALDRYHGDPAGWAAHVRTYVLGVLIYQAVTRDELDELVRLVQQCPRCGK